MKHNKHIVNQNLEAFTVITINYTFSVFLLCLVCKIIFFFKKTDSQNEIILFCWSIDPSFFAVLAVDQKRLGFT